ncbi:O-antigen ligase family protein [uncultured Psychrobacter sp.]|uniref:O-antigen ligase family protein n=1 Tax=uncultured Psychrobacter sp. TaxID=259303 RepID=UPI003459BF10
MNNSLIPIFLLVVYVLIQSIIFQGSIITIFQAVAMVVFLFFASQIGLTEAESFYNEGRYKSLAKILLFLLPFFLISFVNWSPFRQPGLFMNPNITSHLAVMLSPFVLLGLDQKKYKVLLVGILLVILLATASRSATLAFALGLLSYIVVAQFPRSGFLALLLLLGSVLLASIYSVDIATWFSTRFAELVSSSDSRLLNTGYNARDILLEISINRFKEKPLLGVGFDGTKIILEGHELGTHNGLVETLLKLGIIGTTIFVAFFLSMIWMTSKHNKIFKPATVMSLTAILSLSTNSSTFLILNYLFIYSVFLVYLGYGAKEADRVATSI